MSAKCGSLPQNAGVLATMPLQVTVLASEIKRSASFDTSISIKKSQVYACAYCLCAHFITYIAFSHFSCEEESSVNMSVREGISLEYGRMCI